MPEDNGNRDTRMDRIERALELLISDHEQFRFDHRQLLTAQLLQKDEIDKLVIITREHTRQIEAEGTERREKDAALDARVDNLMSAMGELIGKWGNQPKGAAARA